MAKRIDSLDDRVLGLLANGTISASTDSQRSPCSFPISIGTLKVPTA